MPEDVKKRGGSGYVVNKTKTILQQYLQYRITAGSIVITWSDLTDSMCGARIEKKIRNSDKRDHKMAATRDHKKIEKDEARELKRFQRYVKTLKSIKKNQQHKN